MVDELPSNFGTAEWANEMYEYALGCAHRAWIATLVRAHQPTTSQPAEPILRARRYVRDQGLARALSRLRERGGVATEQDVLLVLDVDEIPRPR